MELASSKRPHLCSEGLLSDRKFQFCQCCLDGLLGYTMDLMWLTPQMQFLSNRMAPRTICT